MKYRVEYIFNRSNPTSGDWEESTRWNEYHATSPAEALAMGDYMLKQNEPTLREVKLVKIEKVG